MAVIQMNRVKGVGRLLRYKMLIGFVFFAQLGCSPEVKCEMNGVTVSQGESINDEERALLCRCTSSGLVCEDATDMSIAQLPPRRTSSRPTMRKPRSSRDAGPAIRPIIDAMVKESMDAGLADSGLVGDADVNPTPVPDLGLYTCPPTLIDGTPCPANATMCGYGLGFDCCGERFENERSCTCDSGRWTCQDHVVECRSRMDGDRCARLGRVCSRWNEMRRVEAIGEDEWNGNLAECIAGDMSADWRSRVLTLVNGYRFFAQLNEVTLDDSLNRIAQDCALAQNARGQLTHNLEDDARCFTDDAQHGSKASNLHHMPAVAAMRDYILDPGNRNWMRLLHRQWILANQLGPVGVGSTNRYSCLYVWYGEQGDGREPPWIAWPPPGPFPYDAGHADRTGWTIHSTRVNLSRAELTVSVDGVERPVRFRQLLGEGPAGWALAFVPDGWRSEPGVQYDIRVDGVFGHNWDGPIEYSIEMVDCDAQ